MTQLVNQSSVELHQSNPLDLNGNLGNVISLFQKNASQFPDRPALRVLPDQTASYAELARLAAAAQSTLRRAGFQDGDRLLLLYPLSIELYAVILGALGLGVTLLLVEPWMPIAKIEAIVQESRPKGFLTSVLGRLWGLRIASVRKIPHWWSKRDFFSSLAETLPSDLEVKRVSEENPIGILTFTSGTTGKPKGVVRRQSYLFDQIQIFTEATHVGSESGPDLTIFANFALLNLATGRTSVVIPPDWKERDLKRVARLPTDCLPKTLTCGPAFLARLAEVAPETLGRLREVHVGGALADTDFYDSLLSRFPEVDFHLIYGSTEVEPVALCPLKVAVERSRDRGFFHTVFLGKPISKIQVKTDNDTLWVSGPHVCPEYLGNPEESLLHKARDPSGTLWHSMGDRVEVTPDGMWYLGRAKDPKQLFFDEQKLYRFLNHSRAFIHVRKDGSRIVVGEDLAPVTEFVRQSLQLTDICEAKILRDARHRARLDRGATLKKAGIQSEVQS